jgi:hypothetical protein
MSSSALQDAILIWIKQHFESALIAALASTSTNAPTPGIGALQTKVTLAMSTLADIQALLATETTLEQKMITLLQSQAATIATLQTQLTNAAAGGDTASINQVASQMQTNVDALNAAVAALSVAYPPAPQTRPDRPDPQANSGAVVPPGAPVIS